MEHFSLLYANVRTNHTDRKYLGQQYHIEYKHCTGKWNANGSLVRGDVRKFFLHKSLENILWDASQPHHNHFAVPEKRQIEKYNGSKNIETKFNPKSQPPT